ncbi:MULTISPECIES: HU family DNA-binding protein [Janibacter]|jgi:DNA-binding protein HU-beta|uniref:Integration host factor n=1 Tax=Janibacter melonis TaxID=262209 RepID=A0A176Q9L3_9MICO|nr:HU family DNA-binding protein [Janibacter melonis]MBD5829252.1 integration host factor [Janibacter melonis]MCB5991079.1 HU family DNA-binding protein [Janibacter melonis]MCM3556470.1 HU family DNA-binding protein [Janibacter melonis]OAB86398.1 integration host factor [Janibacter melonis]QFQ30875.1 integration host factor [Janibacter melonis]
MNKSELASAVAEKAGVSASSAAEVITALQEVLSTQVAKGEKVTVPGFFSLERVERAERKGRNPQTGAEMTIPGGYAAKLSAGSALKAAAKG